MELTGKVAFIFIDSSKQKIKNTSNREFKHRAIQRQVAKWVPAAMIIQVQFQCDVSKIKLSFERGNNSQYQITGDFL